MLYCKLSCNSKITRFVRMTWNQEYVKNKRLLIIGCGGLAHAALPYLLSSGIGNMTLYDGDSVESSNLTRQHLFTSNDIGRNKAAVLKEYCSIHFPKAVILAEERMYIAKEELSEAKFDLVLDCTDRLSTKVSLADHFEKLKIPFFYAAAQMNAGSSGFVHSGSLKSEMLFGHIKDLNKVERNCTEDGVWPTVVAAVGIHVAHQALQFLTLSPCAFVGSIDYYDGVSGLWSRFHFSPKTQQVKPNEQFSQVLKDRNTPIFFLGEAEDLPSEIISITASELKGAIENANRSCVIMCDTGIRAKVAAEQLAKQFNFPVLSWNHTLDSFIKLFHESRA